MFALVQDNTITKMISGNRGITLGDNQYSKQIFSLWSEAERNAIGIYTVTVDTTNKKDEQWYINTNVSYGVESNKAAAIFHIYKFMKQLTVNTKILVSSSVSKRNF